LLQFTSFHVSYFTTPAAFPKASPDFQGMKARTWRSSGAKILLSRGKNFGAFGRCVG
jgi:hypothetical protein